MTPAYLHHLQFLKPFLYQILYLSRVLGRLVFPKGISRPALCILSEIVRLELLSLSQELAVLRTNNPQSAMHVQCCE
jgi:hypothetical protein